MAESSSCAALEPVSIRIAHDRISGFIHRTPLLTSTALDRISSSQEPKQHVFSSTEAEHRNSACQDQITPKFRLFFKCENLQRTGAFKARGAFYAVSHLMDSLGIDLLRRKGVVTASSGNHAQGLALAAATFDVPATIVMPRNSTQSKIQGVASYLEIKSLEATGGQGTKGAIVFCGSSNHEKKAALSQAQQATGAVFVPPYEHADVILGQGTCAKELEEQFGEINLQLGPATKALDAVIAPIGGGGLLGGIATWFSDKPGTEVFGAEPSFEGADDATRGLREGQRISTVASSTIADGLRTPVGLLNWGIISDPDKVNGIYAVGEDEIRMAMKLLFERLKIVAEPSACVPLAVVLFNKDFRSMAARRQAEAGIETWDVAIVVSGGNIPLSAVSQMCVEGTK